MTDRIFLALVMVVCVGAGRADAQNFDAVPMFSEESLRAVALSIIQDQNRPSPPSPLPGGERGRDYRDFWIMGGWLAAATIYDAEATFYLLDQCSECQEQNPITRPIIEQGRLATYLYSAALNAVVMYIAKRMYDRADPWWRIVPLSLSIVHGIAGTWNIYQATQDPQT